MWFGIGLFIIVLVGALIMEITKENAPPVSEAERNRLKDSRLENFFTPKVVVDPNDSLTEDGIRTLRLSTLDDTVASLVIDDFTKNESIVVSRVAGKSFSFLPLYTTVGNSEIVLISMSFGFADNKFRVSLVVGADDLTINRGTILYLLFEEESVVKLEFKYHPHPFQNDLLMNHAEISMSDLAIVASKNLIKWRVDAVNGMIYVGDLTKNIDFFDKNEVRYVVRKMAQSVVLAKAHNVHGSVSSNLDIL